MLTFLSILARFIIGKEHQPHLEDHPEHKHDLLQHELNMVHTDEVRQDERRRWYTKMDLEVRDEWEAMARLKNHAEEG